MGKFIYLKNRLDAMLIVGDIDEVQKFVGEDCQVENADGLMCITNMNGSFSVPLSHWLVKTNRNNFEVYSQDEFREVIMTETVYDTAPMSREPSPSTGDQEITLERNESGELVWVKGEVKLQPNFLYSFIPDGKMTLKEHKEYIAPLKPHPDHDFKEGDQIYIYKDEFQEEADYFVLTYMAEMATWILAPYTDKTFSQPKEDVDGWVSNPLHTYGYENMALVKDEHIENLP